MADGNGDLQKQILDIQKTLNDLDNRLGHAAQLQVLQNQLTAIQDVQAEFRKDKEEWEQKWQPKLLQNLDTKFDSQVATYTKSLMDTIKTLGIFTAVFSPLVLVVSLIVFATQVSSWVNSVKADAEKQIAAAVNEKTLDDKIVQQTLDNYKKRFRVDLSRDTLFGTTAILSQTTNRLRQQLNQSDSSLVDPPYDAVETMDLIYDADKLTSWYVKQLDSPDVTDKRKIALLHMVRAMEKISQSRKEEALDWIDAAVFADYEFKEAHLFKARQLCKRYIDNGKWGAENLSKKEDCLASLRIAMPTASDQAKWLEGGLIDPSKKINPEIYLWMDLQHYANEDLAGAITTARAIAKRQPDDPRVLTRLGLYIWLQAVLSSNPHMNYDGMRKESLHWMDVAWSKDPRYIKALNNYVFFATHNPVPDEKPRSKIPPAEQRALGNRLDKLTNDDRGITMSWRLLDTLATGYFALDDTQDQARYSNYQRKARKYAELGRIALNRFESDRRVIERVDTRLKDIIAKTGQSAVAALQASGAVSQP